MGKSTAQKIREQEAAYHAKQAAYYAQLQLQCKPGQKLMTCSTCGKVMRFPEWQVVVDHLVRNGNFPGRGVVSHPGEVFS